MNESMTIEVIKVLVMEQHEWIEHLKYDLKMSQIESARWQGKLEALEAEKAKGE